MLNTSIAPSRTPLPRIRGIQSTIYIPTCWGRILGIRENGCRAMDGLGRWILGSTHREVLNGARTRCGDMSFSIGSYDLGTITPMSY